MTQMTDPHSMALTQDSPPNTETSAPDTEEARRSGGPRKLWVLVPALVFVIAVGGGAGWFFLRDDGGVAAKRAPATTASIRALASLAATVGHPVYWAGPRDGYRYELTRTADGRIYIRYLPADVAVGTSAPNYLTVGTYPVKDALATVSAIGAKPGASLLKLAGGAVAAIDPDHPLSTYIAYPGSGYGVLVQYPACSRPTSPASPGTDAAFA